jgi:hypothetical protein
VPDTLEQRLDVVEKRVAELGAIVGAGSHQKDWLSTVGTLPDDPLSRKADQLGREYRDQLNDSDERAGA